MFSLTRGAPRRTPSEMVVECSGRYARQPLSVRTSHCSPVVATTAPGTAAAAAANRAVDTSAVAASPVQPGSAALLAESTVKLQALRAPDSPMVGARRERGGDFARYRPQYIVGTGSFGDVWKGIDSRSKRVVAMKYVKHKPQFHGADYDGDSGEELSEAQICARVRGHHNIVQLLDFKAGGIDCETLIFEFLPDGDLFAAVLSGTVTPLECKDFMLQVAAAVSFVHENGFVHNDIKLENMLLSGSCLKLCDFGLSGRDGLVRTGRPHGTTTYMAPELLTPEAEVSYTLSPSLDMWSFGVVLYAVIFASMPWDEATVDDQEFMTFVSDRSIAEHLPWSLLHPTLCDCMVCMLSLRPEDRPSAAKLAPLIAGPWLLEPAVPDIDANTHSRQSSSHFEYSHSAS
mmetsp:Transcript_15946/g.41248  ORF Transcript_15946/g.41248 Transcript_15946/m.41248 type:complete len:402 (+) Transcript_15946:879-2084(+)